MTQKVLILGLGVSGIAATRLAAYLKMDVYVTDDHINTLPPSISALPNVSFVQPKDCEISSFDLLVVSPGVPRKHPIYNSAITRQITIYGELEFGLRFGSIPSLKIGITGSNGKTTVTQQICHLLQCHGINVSCVGNIGNPICNLPLEDKFPDVLAIELSSYQLETMSTPAFDCGLILNITPNHLDRYDSFHAYGEAKCNLQKILKADAPLFIGEKIVPVFSRFLKKENCFSFGFEKTSDFVLKENILSHSGQNIAPFDPLFNSCARYEKINWIATYLACQTILPSLSMTTANKAISSFFRAPHRLEYVGKWNGISYYNDSKATSPAAVIEAVVAIPGPIILIAGGSGKGVIYRDWIDEFPKGKIKAILAIGDLAQQLYTELSMHYSVHIFKRLEEAIYYASTIAHLEDSVLLSPGGASFDQFKNYQERGDTFKRLVKEIAPHI